MILGVGFLLMVSLVASAALAALRKWWGPVFSDWAAAAIIIELGSNYLVITVVFAMIYKIMPRVRIDWKDVWIGAAANSLLFTVGKFLIGVYIGRSGIASGFGAAASLVVVLVWVYYSAQIFCSARSSPGRTRTNSVLAESSRQKTLPPCFLQRRHSQRQQRCPEISERQHANTGLTWEPGLAPVLASGGKAL